MGKQSPLEIKGFEKREDLIVRNDYTKNDEYNETHRDAISDGDPQGKGTGHGGHTHWLPNCRGTIGMFNYSNFDTAISSGAGNDCDNMAREKSLSRSLYNGNYEYSLRIVDTSLNVREGQFVNNYKPRTKRMCYKG